MNVQKERYRVLLIGVGDNTERARELFCKNISENYGISLSLLKEIVDRCPIVLKKNLSLERAVALAKTLRSFGAMASVEEKRGSTAILLEFQEIEPQPLALESSSLRKAESGAWNVIGTVKNISEESLNDTWVLIQLFDDLELLTFDEISIPINPLPAGGLSPFKMVFDGNLPIKRVPLHSLHQRMKGNSNLLILRERRKRLRRETLRIFRENAIRPLHQKMFLSP
jgi:hypothetical protein